MLKSLRMHSLRYVLLLGACALLCIGMLAGCSQQTSSKTQLQVFAANSLEKALPEVQALYTQSHPDVTFADTQFEASGTLVQKLKDGGSADVLITASTKTMDQAQTNGSIDESTRKDMFTNDLVVCTKDGTTLKVKSLKDLATNDAVKSIAIGDPNTVPAGKYALQAFKSAGLVSYDEDASGNVSNVKWDSSIKSKINSGANSVGTVASYVSQGSATVGLVYSSDIYRYDGIKSIFTTPAKSHKDIKYPGAVTSNSSHASAASDFINFCMTDAQAQQIFSKYGFELA